MLRLRAFESLRIVYGTEEAAGGGSAQMINLGQTEPLRLEGGRGAGRLPEPCLGWGGDIFVDFKFINNKNYIHNYLPPLPI